MACRILTLLVLFASAFFIVAGQDGIDVFTTRSSFSAAAVDLNVHDFEGLVPNSGFKHYQREGALSYSGIEFRPEGGNKFGPGPVIVVGAWYQAGPAYETTTGAKLHWTSPNQQGNAFLSVTLPAGVTAVGSDLWSAHPPQSSFEITVTTADGKSRTESFTTPARPAAGFIGFTSASTVVSLRITPPKGQSGLIIDNFTTGKSAGAGAVTRAERNENPRSEARPPVETSTVQEDRTSSRTSIPSARTDQGRRDQSIDRKVSGRAGTHTGSGAIAYVRGSTELRLIDPDGTNDRRLWTHPDLNEQLGIFELAWKPDGSELAFSSAHEATSSPYLADIYAIRNDGTGLRRITNPPGRDGLSRFPKGSVTVNVVNYTPAREGPPSFVVYVEGADEPQQVLIPPGASKTVIFKSVADLGRRPQMVVAMYGKYRWFVPGVDVIPGRNVTAPTFPILDQGFEMHGAFRPVWRSDGSRISFRSGLCHISSTSATPVPGTPAFDPFFAGKNPMGTCTWDWGPTAATANQVIYTENSSGGSNIFQMTEGGAHPGTKLTAFSDLEYQIAMDLQWIPDASGLLYSTVNTFRDSSNIFRFDFATKRTTQVTRLEKEFAREFSISPDGRSVVFERCPDRENDAGCDLWVIGTDGANARLIVRNGQRPAWGR